MDLEINIQTKYQRRINRFGKALTKHNKAVKLISNLRLLSFLLGSFVTFVLYRNNYQWQGKLSGIITLFIFVGLVILHRRALTKVKYLSLYHKINCDSLQRVQGNWKAFKDCGLDFKDDTHTYASDLDIFGQGSLFQWINTSKTFLGRRKLSSFLADGPADIEVVRKRQEAIKELATALSWRHRYLVEGTLSSQKAQDPSSLFKWALESHDFYQTTFCRFIFRLIPVITISLIISYFALEGVPFYLPIMAIIFQATILFLVGKNRFIALQTVNNYAANLVAYKQMLKLFESRRFKSDYLRRLQKDLAGPQKVSAFKQIEKLERIVEAISDRNNAMFLIINIILLWDYQCMMALEQWKVKSGKNLEKWLQIIGEVEALASLAVIGHDNPDWVIPTFEESGEPTLKGQAMGHPLLSEERVYNDIQIDKESRVLLITGSNMSGKSTYLRTAGINLVLAYAGAPVCALYFHCSAMSVYTCMRVSDNLEKNISSFYAELLRVKIVVAANKKEEQIFFLLDEIFKGTNSQDRHLGAKILIKELTEQGAIGMVSTHDLELGDLEKETARKIKNYHFKEYYVNGKISFDYKLRSGISTTRNALYLMKMVGIDTESR